MARDANIEEVHVRSIYDVISADAFVIDLSSAIAAEDYIHTGVITFDDAFLESSESFIEIKKVIVRETVGAGETLAKANLRIYFFDDIDAAATITKNNDFDWADLGTTTLDNMKLVVKVATADYQVVKSSGNSLDAIAQVTVVNGIIKMATGAQRALKAIIVLDSGPATFDANATLGIDLIAIGG